LSRGFYEADDYPGSQQAKAYITHHENLAGIASVGLFMQFDKVGGKIVKTKKAHRIGAPEYD